MARWGFNLVAFVSLLLCGASAAMWVRGHRGTEAAMRWWRTGFFSCGTLPGQVWAQWDFCPWWNRPSPGWTLERGPGAQALAKSVYVRDKRGAARAGFGIAVRSAGDRRYGVCFAPAWFLTGIAAVLPAGSFWRFCRRMRGRSRRRRGLCTRCGYDLRATPGRCPECGEVGASGASRRGKFRGAAVAAITGPE